MGDVLVELIPLGSPILHVEALHPLPTSTSVPSPSCPQLHLNDNNDNDNSVQDHQTSPHKSYSSPSFSLDQSRRPRIEMVSAQYLRPTPTDSPANSSRYQAQERKFRRSGTSWKEDDKTS